MSIPAICPRCGDIVPLSKEIREQFGTRGWWHERCHEIATAEADRAFALKAIAKNAAWFTAQAQAQQ